MEILAFLISAAGIYAAYRIVRSGFDRPQSERWNFYGVGIWVFVAFLVLSYALGKLGLE